VHSRDTKGAGAYLESSRIKNLVSTDKAMMNTVCFVLAKDLLTYRGNGREIKI
jgi:hypothetical protein